MCRTVGWVISFSTFLIGCVDYPKLWHADKLSDAVVSKCVSRYVTSLLMRSGKHSADVRAGDRQVIWINFLTFRFVHRFLRLEGRRVWIGSEEVVGDA